MLSAPGDYFTDDLAGGPIIALRDQMNEVRVFHNVCRHRAGPLATDESGQCGSELRCKYHGWRYALDGRLKNARDFGVAAGFDPRDFSLIPIAFELWRGFIFANLSDNPPPLAELMAPVAQGWPDETIMPFDRRRTHVIACNWKAYVENYLEGYHVPDVHPGLDAEIDASGYRVDMQDRVAVHTAPSKLPNAVYSGYWAWVWPLLGVNVYQHGVMMERITPIDPHTTRLDYLYFYDPKKREELSEMMALSDAVTNEDKEICERVQRNLNAGAYTPGPLSPRHESALAWFQATWRERLGV